MVNVTEHVSLKNCFQNSHVLLVTQQNLHYFGFEKVNDEGHWSSLTQNVFPNDNFSLNQQIVSLES